MSGKLQTPHNHANPRGRKKCAPAWIDRVMKSENMKKELQKSMTIFFSEAKSIDGTEDAIFELSDEIENCLILTGTLYGKQTHDILNKLGKQNGLLILARDLSVLYDKPNSK
jgi:hypothetical protein